MRGEGVVLDVNKLSDLEPLRGRLEECGLPASAPDTWFAATLRDVPAPWPITIAAPRKIAAAHRCRRPARYR